MRGLLIDTFTRQINTPATDGQGGWTESWADSTEFKGRLSALPVNERLASDKITVYATHRLYCEYLTIAHKDRVKLGSRYFEIKGIRNPSNTSYHLEIDVLEID